MAIFLKQDTKPFVRDQNRFRKVYRYIRKKPVPKTCVQSEELVEIQWERGIVTFNNQDSKTIDFVTCFTATPAVIAMPAESTDNNANVMIFATDISQEMVTFRTSALFTGKVHFQAIKPGVYNMANIGKKVEVVELDFSSAPGNTISHTWDTTTQTFTCVPVVSATASEDVNVFVTAVSTSSVTVQVSQNNYSGKVYLIGIERGC